jgi:hypothetical protein
MRIKTDVRTIQRETRLRSVTAPEEAERRASGILLHSEVVEWFDDACGEFSVSPLKRA